MNIKIHITTVLILCSTILYGQKNNPVVQFNGIVIQGDSLYGISKAYIYVPNTSRGTQTNNVGYFSFPVMPGDSVVVSKWGFKKQFYIVPKTDTIIDYKIEDTLTLPIIELSAFPSEKKFKELFLSMNIPMTNYNNATTNLNTQILQRLFVSQQISPTEAYKYYVNEQVNYTKSRNSPQQISLLSPFAWNRFFKDLKEYNAKKKK